MSDPMEDNLHMSLRDILPRIQQRIMCETSYFGVKTLKNPFDYWVYQEIIYAAQPDVIVEIGTNWGGSTLALAHQLDLLGKGRVIGIDIDHSKVPIKVRAHPRIHLIENSAVAALAHVERMIDANERVLVIEDSCHTYENTLAVLRLYSQFIRSGDYFIVEDSICHHGLEVGPSPGPYEAIETFIGERDDFVIDRSKESFFITWNPKGFLKRKR
jgi:cephalosporin hydroxylase